MLLSVVYKSTNDRCYPVFFSVLIAARVGSLICSGYEEKYDAYGGANNENTEKQEQGCNEYIVLREDMGEIYCGISGQAFHEYQSGECALVLRNVFIKYHLQKINCTCSLNTFIL